MEKEKNVEDINRNRECLDSVDLLLNNSEFYNKYNRKKIVAVFTLGCKVNHYETEAMIEKFVEKGYELADNHDYADVYIVNTCTVTNLSDRKSRQLIRKAKRINPKAIIGVVGCYAQVAPEEVAKISEIDVIAGTKDKYRILELCEEFQANKTKIVEVTDIMLNNKFDETEITQTEGRTRAYIKIQEGCNNFCSYCIIPYARGPIRSRELKNIIHEVNQLVKEGFKEMVLTGIHVASYGKDLGEERLIDVIEAIGEISGVERIRLSSLEPTYVTLDFLQRVSVIKSFCPHFHLSLQSGSDTVLKRMNRKYTTKLYSDVVNSIRKYYPLAAITTDIIVGFPGETDEEYMQTVEFVKNIEFSDVHVFRYSPRTGTPAAERKDQVDGNVKNDRSKALIEVVEILNEKFNKKFIDETVEVLFEQEENSCMIGHTMNYLKVRTEVPKNLKLQEGSIHKILIKKNNKSLLIGILK